MVDVASVIIFIVILSLFFLGISLARDRKSQVLSKSTPWKKRVLVIATPSQPEKLILFLHIFFFFIADLAQNKAVDLGSDYRVIVFGQITALAVDVWVVFLILFHITLLTLFLMSLRSKFTNRVYDVIVGAIALFGVAILLAGVLPQLYGAESVRFLFFNFRPIDFYHMGVYMEIFAGLYWAFTK